MRGRLARNSAWSLGAVAVTAVCMLAETVLLAQHLSPERFGTFLLLIAYPEAVQQILDFRVKEAMTKYLGTYLAQDRKDEGVAVIKLLWFVDAGVSILAVTIVAATAPLLAGLLLDDSGVAGLMIAYAFGNFLGSLDTASGSILRVLDRFALSFGAGAASSITRFGLIAAVVATGGGITALVWARVGAHAATSAFQGTTSLLALRKPLGAHRRAKVGLLRPQFPELRGFMISTNLMGVVRLASTKLDTLLLGAIATPAAVGLYKVALQFATAPQLLTDALTTAVYPRFIRDHAQGRAHELRRVALRGSLVVAGLVAPPTIAVGLFAGDVMALIGGEDYRPAGTVLSLCLCGILPYALAFWVYPLLLTTGNQKVLLKLFALAAAIHLGGIALLAPELGAEGAGAAVGASYLSLILVGLVFVWRRGLLPLEDAAT